MAGHVRIESACHWKSIKESDKESVPTTRLVCVFLPMKLFRAGIELVTRSISLKSLRVRASISFRFPKAGSLKMHSNRKLVRPCIHTQVKAGTNVCRPCCQMRQDHSEEMSRWPQR